MRAGTDFSYAPYSVWRTPLKRSTKPIGSVRKGRDSQRFVTTEMKRRVLERDGYACKACGATLDRFNSTIDHISPWHSGGRTEMGNLQALCRACNALKSRKSHEEFEEIIGRLRRMMP